MEFEYYEFSQSNEPKMALLNSACTVVKEEREKENTIVNRTTCLNSLCFERLKRDYIHPKVVLLLLIALMKQA